MPTPSPRRLMARFEKFRGLCYSISAAYSVAWKCDVSEPMSLALVLFCDSCWRYDPAKNNSFRKYLNYRLRWGLADEGKRRERKLGRELLAPDLLDQIPAFQREFDLTEFLSALSPDAQEAARLALSTGGSVTRGYRETYKGVTRGVSKELLEQKLSRRGWTRARCRTAFSEIKQALFN